MKKFLLLSLITIFVIVQTGLSQSDSIWTKKTGGTAKKIDAMDVSHNSQYILIAGSHTFTDTITYHSIFNLSNGVEVITFENSYKYKKTFFSITDDTIISLLRDKDLILMHSTESGQEIGRITYFDYQKDFALTLGDVVLSPNGNQLLFLYKYGHYGYPIDFDAHDTLLIYDLIDTSFKKSISIQHSLVSPKYLPNTNKLLLGQNVPIGMNEGWRSNLIIYNLDNDSTEYLSFYDEAINSILVSDDGYKAFIYRSGGKFQIWDLINKAMLLNGTNILLRTEGFVNKNNFIIMPNWDTESIDVINIANGDTVYRYNDLPILIENIIVSKDTNYIVTNGSILNDTLGMIHGNYLVVYNNLFKDYQSVESNEKENFNSIIKPNPTDGITNIDLIINIYGNYSIRVADNNGKIIEQIFNGNLEPGKRIISWDAGKLPGGMYFIVIQGKNYSETLKLVKE